MASSSENNILETIDVLPVKEFPQMFVQSIVAIFEYSKDEIIDWLKTKSFLSLMSLRDLVLAELVKKLPQFVGRNTYHRRKAELLAKDIYIFGFSTVSGLADKRLYSECFKPTADENTSQISMDQDAEDSNEVENNSVNTSHRNIDTILDMCVQLKDRVKKLETTVKLQAERITALETECNKDKLSKELQSNPVNVIVDEDSKEQFIDGKFELLHSSAQADPPPVVEHSRQTQDHPTDSRSNLTSRTTEDAANKAQKESLRLSDKAPAQLTNNPTQPEGPESSEFQHTTQYRRNILRGRASAASINKPDTRGSSTGNHKIQAAGQSIEGTFLVYVGKLHSGTTVANVREHLADINIKDVSDIMCLNNRNYQSETSFCISINSETSMHRAFQADLWPTGIIIRPFRPPYKGHHRTRQSVIHHQKPQPKEDVRRSQNYVRSYRHDARQRNVHFDYNHGVAWQSPRFTNNGRRY